MTLVLEAENIEFHDMKICGAISTLWSVGRKDFFLNCNFCDHTYVQLNNFIKHMCEDHFSDLTDLDINKPGDDILELKEESEYGGSSPDCDTMLDSDHKEPLDFKGFEKVEIEESLDNIQENINFEESISTQIFKAEEKAEVQNDEVNENDNIFEIASDVDSFQQVKHLSKNVKRNDLSTLRAEKKIFITKLIKEYRSLPALWDINSKAYHNTQLKNEQLEILLTKYRERYPDATKEDVKKRINGLCSNFRREWRKSGLFGKSTLYYFNEMSFLVDCTQLTDSQANLNDLDELEDIPKKESSKFRVPGSSFNNTQFIHLAHLYKRHTCLWDEYEITYRFTNRRQEALEDMLKEFRETSGLPNITKNLFEREIFILRKLCATEKKKKIECSRNNINFKPTCPFYDDIAFLEVDVAPYQCSICGDLISAWTLYKKHLSSHDGTPPFKCHICGNGFSVSYNLTVHLRAHAKDFTHKCEVCNKPFGTKNQLKTHMRTHTGEKPYVCYFCGKVYTGKSAYLVHMQRHENKPRHKCHICSKPFYNKQNLKEHISSHLQVRNYICNVCQKGFTSAKHLRQHKQIHAKVKKYVCNICGNRFAQCAGLNSHMKSHGTRLSHRNSDT